MEKREETSSGYLMRPMAVLEPVPITTARALPAVTTVPYRICSNTQHSQIGQDTEAVPW